MSRLSRLWPIFSASHNASVVSSMSFPSALEAAQRIGGSA